MGSRRRVWAGVDRRHQHSVNLGFCSAGPFQRDLGLGEGSDAGSAE